MPAHMVELCLPAGSGRRVKPFSASHQQACVLPLHMAQHSSGHTNNAGVGFKKASMMTILEGCRNYEDINIIHLLDFITDL